MCHYILSAASLQTMQDVCFCVIKDIICKISALKCQTMIQPLLHILLSCVLTLS